MCIDILRNCRSYDSNEEKSKRKVLSTQEVEDE